MNFYSNILENKGPVIGDDYFLQTKEEIEKWLQKMNITGYKINEDLTVNTDYDVHLSDNNIKKIPVKFNKIEGDFMCYDKLIKWRTFYDN